ncbi:MAG: hypothetical protein WCW40_03475 [Bacteroidota bacterium]
MYKSESILVNKFVKSLTREDTPFTGLNCALEFNYNNGKVDIIAVDQMGHVFSFEAKLRVWKKAFQQAHRNSSFSHYSYVVIPKSQINNVLQHEEIFIKRGIGLCSIDSNKLEIFIMADRKHSIQPWLTQSAKNYVGLYP